RAAAATSCATVGRHAAARRACRGRRRREQDTWGLLHLREGDGSVTVTNGHQAFHPDGGLASICRERSCEVMTNKPVVTPEHHGRRSLQGTQFMTTPQTPKVRFKEHTSLTLHEALAPLGVDARLARRLQAAVMQKVGVVPERMPEVPRRILDAVRQNTEIPRLKRIEKVVSPTDGFAKYAFTGEGEGVFEAVRIPLLHRAGNEKYVVCVSSQVGCAMGCTFCATGRMGFRRNLATWEMVDQVMHVRDDSEHPVRGVVFMGMGEPMLNYERVLRACEVMCDPCGLAIEGKAITISTVGIVPGI